MQRVAIIGGGIAGLAAARQLHRRAAVTLIEARDELGGHVRTVSSGGASPVALDCGFIVFNHSRYPGFSKMLRELGIESQPSQMSFGVSSSDGRFSYSTRTPRTLFADPRTLLDPTHRGMVRDIFSFLARARRDHRVRSAVGLSLGEYLDRLAAGPALRERFVYPLAGALWSAGRRETAQFPAEVFLGFMSVHGMLRPALAPRWRTVKGGSATYVAALRKTLAVEWRLGSAVTAIERDAQQCSISLADGSRVVADRVIIAAHANRALEMLAEPSEAEARHLGAIRFTPNMVVVHTDERALPANPHARAAWNYRVTESGSVDVTYWCNKLQALSGDTNYMVTLNPRVPIDTDRIIYRAEMSHPCFDLGSLAARRALSRMQGAQRTYYAGAYFGYGFHEDGFRAGVAAASALLADGAADIARRRAA